MKTVNTQTILKIKKIFKLGYIPSRGNENYKIVDGNNVTNYAPLINCLGHACFNLTNEHLKDFDKNDASILRNFIQSPLHANTYIAKDIFNFVKKCGLKIKPTKRHSLLKDNEWKIALYFGWYGYRKDYHFLLQEKDGTWSSKWGSSSEVIFLNSPTKKLNHCGYDYTLYGFYKISNPMTKQQTKHIQEKEIL